MDSGPFLDASQHYPHFLFSVIVLPRNFGLLGSSHRTSCFSTCFLITLRLAFVLNEGLLAFVASLLNPTLSLVVL